MGTKAALVKTLVQVYSQTEASSSTQRVGLARNEPNRNPTVTFPAEGRDWKATLPLTAQLLGDIGTQASILKKRCLLLICLAIVLFVIYQVSRIERSPPCRLFERNCVAECTASATCQRNV